MIIADHPLHRSGQAALPHPAPALGHDVEALQRPGMADVRMREPTADVWQEALPRNDMAVATSSQAAPPEPPELAAESPQRGAVAGSAVVANVAGQHRAQVAQTGYAKVIPAQSPFDCISVGFDDSLRHIDNLSRIR